MNNELPLIYVRKSDNKIFHAKKIIHGEYVLVDPLTGEREKIGRYQLRKHYEYQEKVSSEEVRKTCQPLLMPRFA